MATTAEQLERVQGAIARIESGHQEVQANGRRYTNADLATLYARERELVRKLDRESRGGVRVRRYIPLG